MGDEEEKNESVKYWKMKYNAIFDQYVTLKERSEKMEIRLLELAEELEKLENEELNKKKKLEEAKNKIKKLELICFRYENEKNSVDGLQINQSGNNEKAEKYNKTTKRKSIIYDAPLGESMIDEYLKLPVLSKGEGFIFGFRWNQNNKIHHV